MGIPTNMADAAAAIKDGVFGPIDTVKIGDLVVSALQGLSAPSELRITRKPIEAGYEITDAAIDEPKELVMDIVLANPDFSIDAGLDAALLGSFAGFLDTWRDKKAYLHLLQETRELVEVQTHEGVYESMLVRLIDPIYDTDENWDAFVATVYMSEVEVIQTGLGGLIDQAEEAAGGL